MANPNQKTEVPELEGLKAEHQRILGRTYDPDVYDRAFTFAASGVFNHVPTRSLSARAYIHRKFLTKVAAGVLAVAAVAGTGIGLQSAATARHAAEQERTVVALETNVQHSLNRIFTLPSLVARMMPRSCVMKMSRF